MIKSNFNSVTILCKGNIILIDERNRRFEMKLPTLRDQYELENYNIFLSFCGVDVTDFNKENNLSCKNIWGVYLILKSKDSKTISIIHNFCLLYMKNSKCVDGLLYWEDKLVNEQMFEYFIIYCAIAMGIKDIKELDYVITKDMDEITKKQIEMEKRIARTKQRGKEGGKAPKLEAVLTAITHDFPYKYTDLYNMTLYSIYYLYEQLPKIMSYEIGNIAAGNGLLKKNSKYSHWSNNDK